MKKLELTREKYENLCKLMSTDNKENHMVAHAIIAHLNLRRELPYFLLLYMKCHYLMDDYWTPLKKKVDRLLKEYDSYNLENLTYDSIFNLLVKYYTEYEVQLMLDQFAEIFKGQFNEWKHHFIDKVDFKITLKHDQTDK